MSLFYPNNHLRLSGEMGWEDLFLRPVSTHLATYLAIFDDFPLQAFTTEDGYTYNSGSVVNPPAAAVQYVSLNQINNFDVTQPKFPIPSACNVVSKLMDQLFCAARVLGGKTYQGPLQRTGRS